MDLDCVTFPGLFCMDHILTAWPWFDSWFHHSDAGGPWVYSLVSLCIRFVICQKHHNYLYLVELMDT
jgi:hypothetical protein